MHIGFLTPEYVTAKRPEGGLANYLKKTADALANRGHSVTIFLLSDAESFWYDDNVRIVEIARRVPSEKYYPGKRMFNIFLHQIQNSKIIARKVLECHRHFPLDIIQASNYEAPGNALVHNKYIPIVCRASSHTPLWRRAYGRPRTIEDVLIEWLEFRQIKESDASFSPSYFIADIFSKKLNREIPVVRTPLDIPLNEFLDTSFYNQFLKNKKYILFFGTLSKIKGPDLIAEIIPRVLKENPDLFFVFIGRDDGLYGGERMTDYIKNRVKPFDENVFCHPAISKSKLYAVIAHAHGVVLPSRVDNYPNACLEAQYFGKPVIGSRDSSLEEMIIDGKTGFLARNGDIEDLYSCITRLLNLSDTEYNKMSTDIQKQIKTMLNEDRVGQLLHFYENVIKNYRKDKKDPT